MQAFIIGNGLSRMDYNLENLRGYGTTFGCNRIYKEFEPDYLVAIDTDMIKELAKYAVPRSAKDLPRKWKLISREFDFNATVWITCNGKKIIRRSQLNRGLNNNSGIMAAAYAAEILRIPRVYLLGIDFFQPVPSGCNDMYSRNTLGSPALIKIWNQLVRYNKQTEFIRVGPIAESDVDFYAHQLRGFNLMSYEDFPF